MADPKTEAARTALHFMALLRKVDPNLLPAAIKTEVTAARSSLLAMKTADSLSAATPLRADAGLRPLMTDAEVSALIAERKSVALDAQEVTKEASRG